MSQDFMYKNRFSNLTTRLVAEWLDNCPQDRMAFDNFVEDAMSCDQDAACRIDYVAAKAQEFAVFHPTGFEPLLCVWPWADARDPNAYRARIGQVYWREIARHLLDDFITTYVPSADSEKALAAYN